MSNKNQDSLYYEKKADKDNKFYLAHEYTDKGKIVEAHFHKSLEIMYVHSGKVCACVNGQKKTMLAGQIIIVNSYDVHYYVDQPNSKWYLLMLGENLIQEFTCECKGYRFPAFLQNVEDNQRILKILEFWLSSAPLDVVKNKGFSLVLLSALKDICKMEKESRENNSVLIKIISFIENNYTEDISLDDLAAHIGYSVNYCSRLFNKAMGESFCAYVNGFRARKAKSMIKQDVNNDKTILEIAFACGFNSVNSFYRSYSRVFGALPRRSNIK